MWNIISCIACGRPKKLNVNYYVPGECYYRITKHLTHKIHGLKTPQIKHQTSSHCLFVGVDKRNESKDNPLKDFGGLEGIK